MHTLKILQIYIQIVFVSLWCQEGRFLFISLAKLNMGKNCPCSFFFVILTCPIFLIFPSCFLIPINFNNFNYNCSIVSDLRNLHEQIKKYILFQKFVLTFLCLSKLLLCSPKIWKFSACSLEFQKFLRSLWQFFLTAG